jgi:hypothetical protein
MYQALKKYQPEYITVAFRITIKYYQLIMFENFYEFINSIHRNLKVKLRIVPDGLVLCCADPQYSLLCGVITSNLERVAINLGPSGITQEVGCECRSLNSVQIISVLSPFTMYTLNDSHN